MNMLAFVNREYKSLIVVMFLLSVMTVMFSKKIEKQRKEKMHELLTQL